MTIQLRDDQVRAALTPAASVVAPADLGDTIYRALLQTPQRRSALTSFTGSPGRVAVLLLLMTVLLIGLAIAIGAQPPTPERFEVTTYRGDAARTGVMPGPGPAGSVSIGYENQRDGRIGFQVMPIVSGGVVYVVDGAGYASALAEDDLHQLWKVFLDSAISNTPVLVNGTLVVGVEGGMVYALDPSGQEVWHFNTDSRIAGSLGADGTAVLVPTHAGKIVALDLADGTKLWEVRTNAPLERGPAIAEGVMYVGNDAGDLFAFDLETVAETREPMWHVHVDEGRLTTPLVADGVVYIGTGLAGTGPVNRVVALRASDGVELWDFPSPSNLPLYVGAIDPEFLFASSDEGNLYAINLDDHTSPWNFHTFGAIGTGATLVNGILYIASEDHTAYAMNAETGAEVWRLPIAGGPTMPVVVNGRVILGTDVGMVQAIIGSIDPEASP